LCNSVSLARVFVNCGTCHLISDRRSKYLHESLLGKGEIRGIRVLLSGRKEEKELNEDKEILEKLVNASLVEWLRKN